jgi:hypothetical protein
MGGRLFKLTAVISLLLCAAAGALWLRGLWHFELANVTYTRWPATDRMYSAFAQLSWYRDTLEVQLITSSASPVHFSDPSSKWFNVSPADQPPGWQWSSAGDRTTQFMNGYPHGFHWQHYIWAPVPGYRSDTWQIGVRPWLIVALLLVLPAAWINGRRKKRRARLLGLCPHCGYDLRATPDRCPECGTACDTAPATAATAGILASDPSAMPDA